jgi:hypothetical protein
VSGCYFRRDGDTGIILISFRIATLGITTFGIVTFGIATFGIATFGIATFLPQQICNCYNSGAIYILQA